ncbi:MAG: SufBD protein [Candidatus Metalachnospira sp.]|nr:SufBD protein [Candidatus Metalachnospira sp.]
MENIAELVSELCLKDANVACGALKKLTEECEENKEVYDFFDKYAEMIDNKNSYIRTRGLLLTAACAKWDSENKINEIIDKYLVHVTDEKPITSRQVIQALPNIIKYKPELKEKIAQALKNADVSKYKETMAPLIIKDINSVLKLI